MSIPLLRASVAYVWRRSWNLISLSLSLFVTSPMEALGLVLGVEHRPLLVREDEVEIDIGRPRTPGAPPAGGDGDREGLRSSFCPAGWCLYPASVFGADQIGRWSMGTMVSTTVISPASRSVRAHFSPSDLPPAHPGGEVKRHEGLLPCA